MPRALCPRLDTKLLSSRGSHWKQSLYSYGVEFCNEDSNSILTYVIWVDETMTDRV
ncbi:hypothetical protein HanPI659440_Chr17g0690031 [Helianthus annuus]|nr:hypothetical protein HanPI659440_Chr17g0690031 [Helianthus annuus]